MVKKIKIAYMKNIYSLLFATFLAGLLALPMAKVSAGNKDRSGQAGAAELLIDPWAKSSGWGSVGTANAYGLEALYANIAGTAATKGTEIIFSYTDWLQGSDTRIMNFGFS